MTVAYPRKFQNVLSARDVLKRVVCDREINLITLNRYGSPLPSPFSLSKIHQKKPNAKFCIWPWV
ncbi:hypothetical protein [Nostoc sp.]|uniref:hypothetical protein n=1 Tax=Nostoc sp. TaxID=1180 RepID=UPI002FF100D4